MLYTSEDGNGSTVSFRLMDRIRPQVTGLAIALGFPRHVIALLKNDSDSVRFLLTEWLRGGNQVHDSRPLTWGTLITALREADLQEEVRILEEHFVAAHPPVAVGAVSLSSMYWLINLNLMYTRGQDQRSRRCVRSASTLPADMQCIIKNNTWHYC